MSRETMRSTLKGTRIRNVSGTYSVVVDYNSETSSVTCSTLILNTADANHIVINAL